MHRPRTLRRLVLRSAATIAVAASIGACQKDVPPTEPEGGLQAFTNALASRDTDAIYERLSPDTQALCETALATLHATDEAIQQLQPSDRADARAATGVDALEELPTASALFASLLATNNIPSLDDRDRYRDGLGVSSTVPVAGDTVMVVSKADQEFELKLGDDGEWRIREPMYSLLEGAVARIHSNAEAVDNAVRLFGVGAEVEEELRELGLLE